MKPIPTISLRLAKAAQMPYPTAGDWHWEEDGSLLVRSIITDDPRSTLLVQFHELIEAVLCKARDITEEDVTTFDKANPESLEPGDELSAPYQKEHSVAMALERLLATELGIPWKQHEENLDAAMGQFIGDALPR
jgi:hypothetical protein